MAANKIMVNLPSWQRGSVAAKSHFQKIYECEARRKRAEGRESLSKAHRRALTISCIQKGKRTHMRIGNTRLLIMETRGI